VKISARWVLVIFVLVVLSFAGIIYHAEVNVTKWGLTYPSENYLTAKVEGRSLLSWDGGESWYCYEGETLVAKVEQNSECPALADLDVLTAEAKARNDVLWKGSFWLPTLYKARKQIEDQHHLSYTASWGEQGGCEGISLNGGVTFTAIDPETGEVLGSFYKVCPQAKTWLLYDLLVQLDIDLNDPADRQFLEDLGIDLEEFGIRIISEDT